jgi:hypothetical protein
MKFTFIERLSLFTVKTYFAFIHKSINSWKKSPLEHQEKVFSTLMKKGEKTKFGVAHGLHANMSYSDYQKRVPIHDYERFLPWIKKVIEGEKSILWPGKPLYLATTSGTTSGEKFIPVTKDSLRKGMKSTVLCTATYLEETNNTEPLQKKMVILSANPTLKNDKVIPYGKITGIFNNHIPNFMKKQRLPSIKTNCIADWEEKITKTAEETIGQDVGMVGGFPAWIIRYFEHVLERTGKKTIAEVFPNLQVITHGGVAYPPYRKRMESLIGKPFHRLEVFSASEGFIAFQDSQHADDLLLVPNAEIFYEFVPLIDWGSPSATRIPLSQVEINIPYAMVITTMAGLWAYDLGDTITFTSLSPYRLKVSGRVKHFISNSGEHLISEQVEKALSLALDKYQIQVKDFSVAPLIENKEGGNRHEWLIEFDTEPSSLTDFSFDLHQNLKNLSDNYTMLVETGILSPPKVSPLKTNAFVEYMKSINKMTHQNKVPRLMNNRDLADAMKPWIKVTP